MNDPAADAETGDRGTVYGVTAPAMVLGQSLGPLVATALLLAANLVWVWAKVPEVR